MGRPEGSCVCTHLLERVAHHARPAFAHGGFTGLQVALPGAYVGPRQNGFSAFTFAFEFRLRFAQLSGHGLRHVQGPLAGHQQQPHHKTQKHGQCRAVQRHALRRFQIQAAFKVLGGAGTQLHELPANQNWPCDIEHMHRCMVNALGAVGQTRRHSAVVHQACGVGVRAIKQLKVRQALRIFLHGGHQFSQNHRRVGKPFEQPQPLCLGFRRFGCGVVGHEVQKTRPLCAILQECYAAAQRRLAFAHGALGSDAAHVFRPHVVTQGCAVAVQRLYELDYEQVWGVSQGAHRKVCGSIPALGRHKGRQGLAGDPVNDANAAHTGELSVQIPGLDKAAEFSARHLGAGIQQPARAPQDGQHRFKFPLDFALKAIHLHLKAQPGAGKNLVPGGFHFVRHAPQTQQ